MTTVPDEYCHRQPWCALFTDHAGTCQSLTVHCGHDDCRFAVRGHGTDVSDGFAAHQQRTGHTVRSGRHGIQPPPMASSRSG